MEKNKLDKIMIAVEETINNYQGFEPENFCIDYFVKYNGKIGISSMIFQNQQDLIEKIYKNIIKYEKINN